MIWQIVAFKCIFNKWHSITMRHKLCRALTLDALASRPVACFPCVLCKTSLSDSTVMDKSRLEFPPENLMIVSGLLRNKHNVVFTCMKWCRMWNSAWDANVRVCNCITISVDEWNVPVQLLLFIIIIVVIIIIMIIIIIKKKKKKKKKIGHVFLFNKIHFKLPFRWMWPAWWHRAFVQMLKEWTQVKFTSIWNYVTMNNETSSTNKRSKFAVNTAHEQYRSWTSP